MGARFTAKPSGLLTRLLCVALSALMSVEASAQQEPNSTAAPAKSQTEVIRGLAAELLQADTSGVPPHTSTYFIGNSAVLLAQLNKPKLALSLWQRCKEIDQRAKRRNPRRLLGFAVDIGRLDLAEEIQQSSPELEQQLRPDLLLAKYAGGNDEAIDQYIIGESQMTFYTAMDVANAYIAKGLYNKAEDFVVNTTITEENSPEDLIGITFENIARRCRKLEDQEQALKYIDKALAVAGNQYYTGQAIKVRHHSMHATLHSNVDSLATTAQRYRGSQGRELTLVLIRQLIDDGLFDDAKQVVEKLESSDDTVRSLQNIAGGQAKAGEYRAAFQTLKSLAKPGQRNIARIEIAKAMARTGHGSTARETANFVVENLAGATVEDDNTEDNIVDEQHMALASFYALIDDAEQMKTHLKTLKTATNELKSLHQCLQTITPVE